VISGLEKQDNGHVLFDDTLLDTYSPADRDTAIVFQQYSLYPTMTVYENLAFPLKAPQRKYSKERIDERIQEVAKVLRITHLLQRKTAKLSGGEMQRVSIGRAIVREPRVFLMDEPLSNLDAKLRETLRVELQHLQKQKGVTMLYVTHDQIEAMTMADRIGVLDHGRLIQLGTPEDIYDRPGTTFVAQLVGTRALTPSTRCSAGRHQPGRPALLDRGPHLADDRRRARARHRPAGGEPQRAGGLRRGPRRQAGRRAAQPLRDQLHQPGRQAVEVVDRVDHPACGIMLDTFHMNIEEKSLGDAIRAAGPRLKHLHACENDRGAPGRQRHLGRGRQGAGDIGYDGPVVIESFTAKVKSIARAAAIWRALAPTQDDLARDGVRFLKRLLV
jgi:ABC-type proline/glycine betaine transport system ATPase subunit